MKESRAYRSTADKEYEHYLQESLNETEKSIIKLLAGAKEPCIEDKNLAQIAREMHRSCGEIRSSVHHLLEQGIIIRNKRMHYKLTRAGKRLR